MPRRKTPLVNNEIYHVFNRGVNKQLIFKTRWDYSRAMETYKYYLYKHPPVKYSVYKRQTDELRKSILKDLINKGKKVEIIAFCLMPNHYHFLLRQNIDNGISNFLKVFQISYSRYFNTKHKRSGPLLEGQFKAVRVEDDNQLIHLSRYIHLNPYTSYVVKELNDLGVYPWSSYQEYLSSTESVCNKELIFTLFKNISDYKRFVLSHADYQRKLSDIKHLLLEN